MSSRTPLIPYDSYEKFKSLEQVSDGERFGKIREYVFELDPLRRNTLHFLIQFFVKVVELEPENKMNAYNMAVTVGPNMFRPESTTDEDIMGVGIFYDAIIRMIENCDAIFGTDEEYFSASFRHGAFGRAN